MNKSSWLAAVTAIVSLFSASIAAAQTPQFEVAGGYAYLHETDLSIPAGWFGSVGATLNDWVGIVGAVSGHYKTQSESGIDVNTKLHTFVAGPKFASYKNRTITPYVQGTVWRRAYKRERASAGIDGQCLSLSEWV
jgi:hypothetical protein